MDFLLLKKWEELKLIKNKYEKLVDKILKNSQIYLGHDGIEDGIHNRGTNKYYKENLSQD